MKAVVVHGPGDIRCENLPTPSPGPAEALIAMKAAGICSSDVPRALGDAAYFYPIVMGHEFSGEVEEVGIEVNGAHVGQRVAVAPLIPCWRCEWCERGRYSLCDDYNYLGSRAQGGYAEYVNVPVRNLVPLPPEVDYEAGAILEPAAVVLHGLGIAGLTPGDDVAVVGAGTLGLLAIQVAMIVGAGRVFATDLVQARLETARSLGSQAFLAGEAVARMAATTHGRGVDLVVETAGTAKAQQLCLDLVRKGGRILFLGMSEKEVTLSRAAMQRIVRQELTIYGSWNSYSAPFPGYEWHAALIYMSRGQLNTEPLITHRFRLQDAKEAFLLMEEGRESFNKVIFVEGGRDEA